MDGPMSSSINGISSPCKIKVEGDIVVQDSPGAYVTSQDFGK
jgi:hypothetical protein